MKKLTVKTKRWAFKHAKEHVLEVLADVLDEEAHSVVTIDGEPRMDVQEEILRQIRAMGRAIKRAKAAN